MADTDEVAKRIKKVDGVEYRVLIMNVKGIERAEAAGLTKAKLTVSASRSHSLSNMKRTPEEVVASFGECAEYAAGHGITLSGAIATSFGCPIRGQSSAGTGPHGHRLFQEDRSKGVVIIGYHGDGKPPTGL